jgi:hypothetical protein
MPIYKKSPALPGTTRRVPPEASERSRRDPEILIAMGARNFRHVCKLLIIL